MPQQRPLNRGLNLAAAHPRLQGIVCESRAVRPAARWLLLGIAFLAGFATVLLLGF